jgi:hypothetical protein
MIARFALRAGGVHMAKKHMAKKHVAKKRKRKAKAKKSKSKKKRWSQHVTDTSDALTLDKGVFTKGSAKAIARSLKRSAEHSHRRKSSPYRSAMSMLTFYLNRGGKGLSAARKKKLEHAKDELRALYGKD